MIYQLRTDVLCDEEGNVHTVYGVDVYYHVRSVPDLFTDKNRALDCIALWNREQPDPVHFDDVIADALS